MYYNIIEHTNIYSPSNTDQIFTWQSYEPVIAIRSAGKLLLGNFFLRDSDCSEPRRRTDVTASACPEKVLITLLSLVFHTLTVVSAL